MTTERPAATCVQDCTARRISRPRVFLLALVVFAVSGFAGGSLTRVVLAAQYQEPGGQPPTGNIPVTVWNALDLPSGVTAQSAAIFVDGGGPPPARVGLQVGTKNLDMGVNAGGQNLVYALTDETKMNDADNLMLLQTAVGTVFTDKFTVGKKGDVFANGQIVAGTNVNAAGCFGPTFQGLSTTAFTGNMNGGATGYYAAKAVCSGQYGDGAHVCSTAELLNSMKCGTAFPPSKIRDANLDNGDAWIQDGPPGYTAPANDCMGWQSNAPSNLGRMWHFNSSTGGQGFLTTCNQSVNFACCK